MLSLMSLGYAPPAGKTPLPSVSLVARPDQARFQLSVQVETESASGAIPLLRRAAQRIEDLLPPLGATLVLGDLDLQSASKTSKAPAAPGMVVTGTLLLPLAKDAPFWDRAQRVAHVDDLLRPLVQEGKRQKPELDVRKANPIFLVADPESFRAELVSRALARARALSKTEVRLEHLRFEHPVTQRPIGLEEVELSLALEGTASLTLP
jgi:hypothetical protein